MTPLSGAVRKLVSCLVSLWLLRTRDKADKRPIVVEHYRKPIFAKRTLYTECCPVLHMQFLVSLFSFVHRTKTISETIMFYNWNSEILFMNFESLKCRKCKTNLLLFWWVNKYMCACWALMHKYTGYTLVASNKSSTK